MIIIEATYIKRLQLANVILCVEQNSNESLSVTGVDNLYFWIKTDVNTFEAHATFDSALVININVTNDKHILDHVI